MEVWIGRDGERHGPYQEGEIRQWLASGQVSGDDLGWYEGLADWQPLSVLFPDAQGSAPPVPASTTPTALPPSTVASVEDYAGFWQRAAAWAIDFLVLLIPSAIVATAMGAGPIFQHLLTQLQTGTAPAVAAAEYATSIRPASLVILVIGFVYYVLFESSTWQATPGKRVLRLRVTDSQGMRLSLGRAAARNVVRLVNAITSLLPLLAYLTVAFTRHKQGLHDLLASTLVLNGRASDFKHRAPTTDTGSFHA